MNCMEFRRLCLSNPRCTEHSFLAHADDCDGCDAFLARQRQLDQRISEAMQIPVPPRIGPEVVLDRGMRQMRRWRLAAIAASALAAVALTVTLSLQMARPGDPPAAVAELAQQLTLHMLRDPIHAVASPGNILGHQHPENTSLEQIMTRLGGDLKTVPEGLVHAVHCLVNGQAAAHLVFEGRREPVTAFVMPGQPFSGDYILSRHDQRTRITDHGRGLIAVIGHHEENLELFVQRLKNSLVLERIAMAPAGSEFKSSQMSSHPPVVSPWLESR